MFIGREAELRFLEERYESNRGELVVLYGRRRVGKTETLRHFSEDKPHVFFSCRECTDQLQLKSFSEKVFKEDIPVKKEPSLESVGQILCALPGKPMFKPPQRSIIIEMRLSMLRKP